MLVLLIQLFLLVFSEKVFALFQAPCINTCDLPGLICQAGRCLCDLKFNLFWTGARCLACPKGWMVTETKCVNYFGYKLPWAQAAGMCQQNQADLISFRDAGTVSLVYQATSNIYGRKKRVDTSIDKTVGWTSARAIQFDDLGLYRWSDNSLGTFNSKSSWWCRQTTSGFGGYYVFNEPTRQFYNNEGESCILYRRGTTSTAVLCLDDVLCGGLYPFICERSESTAQKYFGPSTSNGGTGGGGDSHSHTDDGGSHGNTDGGGSHGNTDGGGSHGNTDGGGSTENTDSNMQNNHHGAIAPDSLSESKTKKKSKIVIIAVIALVLLLLVGVLIGVFFLIKRRNATGAQYPVGAKHNKENPTSTNTQQPTKIDTNVNDINDVDDLATQPPNSDEMDLTLNTDMNPGKLGFNIGNQKQSKNKRGGYSKQQFENEFE